MPYTPIIAATDLEQLIYANVIAEISRNDTGKVARAITTAIQEVKMYLTRYDLAQLFGDPDADTAATFSDDYLKQMCIEVAAWNLIKLGNANVNYEAIKNLYEATIESLKRIQKGLSDPRWPYNDTTTNTAPPSDQVTIIANTPRTNYY